MGVPTTVQAVSLVWFDLIISDPAFTRQTLFDHINQRLVSKSIDLSEMQAVILINNLAKYRSL